MPPTSTGTSGIIGDRDAYGGRYFVRVLMGAFLFSAAINALMLSVPLYSLQVFSRAIPSGNIDTLVMLTLIVVIALSMIALLETVRSRLLNRAGNALEVAWRRRLTAEMLDQAARGRPDATPMLDLMEVKSAMGRPTLTALLDLPWTPLYVLGIYLIHPVLAGLMVAAMVILTVLGYAGHALLKGFSEDQRLPSGRAQRLYEAVQARADTVRGLRMGPAAIDAVTRDSMTGAALNGYAAERGAVVASITKWVRYLLQIGVTAVGGWLVIENHLSFGGMIATSMLVGRGMAALEQTVGSWGAIQKSWQSWGRLSAHIRRLSREPERPGVPVEPERLTLENVLYVNPRDQKPVLRAVSFQVEAGETVCVLGANRSGKTVLARLLAGVQAPSAGTVRLGGLSLAMLTPKDPLTGIGYLPQTADLLPGSIAENIARFLPASDEAVIAAAKMAGVHTLIEMLPQGYETEVMDPASPIGGAFARLIALARAGFGAPSLVVLDEPALGLDDTGIAAVRGFVAAHKERGATVILLSHTAQFIDMADKTFVLQNGMAVAATPRKEAAPPQAAGASFARMRSVTATPTALPAG